jgi:hypothetical protein
MSDVELEINGAYQPMNAHTIPAAVSLADMHPIERDRIAFDAASSMGEKLQIANELVRVIMFLDPDIYHDSRDVSMVTRLTFLISDAIRDAESLREEISSALHPHAHPKEFARNRAMEAAQ